MSKNYNQMHEKLVKNKQDFAGMIAYSIYKTEKRDAIRKGFNVDEFTKIKLTPNEVRKYKKEAEDLVNLLLQASADEEIKRIKEQLAKEINQITIKGLPKEPFYKKLLAWHNGGAAGVIGNFWTGVIVAVFVWFMADQAAWTSAKDSAENAVKNLISKAEAHTEPPKAPTASPAPSNASL
ncbi:hypothetical protein QX226_22360 [Vibrio vulnificus]|uniref:hypothetical protein n=1 Tax=Vibrio vulnificus TaxID=672 RepID=UPI00287B03BE|nr:hypothetical protein [Vibrio vulnificus]MDS1774059.1 hypothetical protein [Vibrio vulnificus]MDS1855213.1 hypothetical protein [Vibrio vulnificus]